MAYYTNSNDKMNVLLLAAGRGERLKPYTDIIPKCMIPIGGVPLLQIWLEKFVTNKNIKKIFINTHYLAEIVHEFIIKNYNTNSKIELIREKLLLGTGGTLVALVPKILENNLFVAHADNLSFFSLNAFCDCFFNRPEECSLTMMTFFCDDPSSCGIVNLVDKNIVYNFEEKPQISSSNLANGAIYLFSRDALHEINTMNNAQEISTDILPKFLGRINTWHNFDYHRDIGTPSSYERALKDMGSKKFSHLIKKVIK